MQPFELVTAKDVLEAIRAQAASQTAQQGATVRFIAGGTNLVDYMKLNVEIPRQLGRHQWPAAKSASSLFQTVGSESERSHVTVPSR